MVSEDEILRRFGARVSQAREKKGLSIRQAAIKCGIDHAAIVRIEQGKVNVTLTTITKIATGLGVPLKSLVDFEI